MTTTVELTEREALGTRIKDMDAKLEALRPRLASLRAEIAQLIEKENHQTRLFAEADQVEKKKIDKELTMIVEQRGLFERECKGLQIAIAELEETRAQIYPGYQKLVEIEQKQARLTKIEELRQVHERNQKAEQEADRRLIEARERSNRSFFAWRAATDQEHLNELHTSTDRLKEEWARNSGPNRTEQPSRR